MQQNIGKSESKAEKTTSSTVKKIPRLYKYNDSTVLQFFYKFLP